MAPLPSARALWQRVRAAVVTDLRQADWRRVGLNIASVIVGCAVLLGLVLAGLNTPPGRRLLVQFATGLKFNSGMKIEIGEIDGSLYGDMTLHDVRIDDAKGAFITSPLIHLDWRPFGALARHVDIRDISSPRIDVLRRPQFNPDQNPQKGGPILPDLRIDVNRLQVDTLSLHDGVLGGVRDAMLQGQVHIARGRALVDATTLSDKGDRLMARLDAEPDKNRLDIDAHLSAPSGGIVADLIGLKKPLTAGITGAGAWSGWNGHLQATLGGAPLLDLALTAQSGRFRLAGDSHPDLILSGQSAALLKPVVRLEATATAKARRIDLVAAATSEAAALDARGRVDLAANRFDRMEAHLRLLDPSRLGKGFSGDDLHADLTFEGAFNDEHVAYDLAAKRFGLGGVSLAGLTAHGRSHRDGTRLIVPLSASLDAMNGINDRVDPLLTHVRLIGDLAIVGGGVTSDNLRLKTDRLQASGTLGAKADGSFSSRIKARLDDYPVAEVGVVSLSTDARVARTAGGVMTLGGTFDARTTRITNSGVEKFLGGNARLGGGYALGAGGAFSLSKLSGTAPLLQLLSGDATFGPRDALAANITARSRDYGPLEATVSGTFDAPHAVVKAASPGLGMGIVDVVADLATTAEGYAVTGTGGSSYGPFSADTLIHKGQGPLTIDIHRAHFAGIDTAGQLVQTAAGPFAGQLSIGGSGLTGTARLSDVNGEQGAAIAAAGSNVDLPGDLKIHVGRTIVTASAVIRKALDLDADVQLADTVYAGVTLSTGRAKVQLHGQNGTVQAVARGAGAVPFDLALNGTIAPDLYSFNAQGSTANIGFHFVAPARVTRSGDDWILAPVDIAWDVGDMRVAGRLGARKTVQMRLKDVDLALVNLVRSDAGLGGKVDGAIDFSQSGDSFPTARAHLTIANFSRASAAVVSTPVDIAMDAALDPSLSPSDNFVHAVIRQGGAVVGQVKLALAPAAGGGWVSRISQGGISGGVRYNGPAGMPFSLAGQARQQLTGAIALAADVSGRLNAPQLNGLIKATALTYDNENLGTRIANLALDGRFSNDRLELTRFSGTAGDGTVKGQGWVSLAANQHFPMQVHVDLSNARLARSDAIDSTVSGTLDITNNEKDGAVIAGDLSLPRLKYTVIRQGAAEVSVLDGVHQKGRDVVQATDNGLAPPSLWKLDIKATAANQIFISGMGLESEWRMNLHLIGTTRDPHVVGDMHAIRGTYAFAGRDFTIDDGVITFDGAALTNPEIQLSASADVNDITGVIKVSGSAQHPDIAFSSTPALPQDEVLSRILFGESVTNLSATEALQLASAVNGLSGGTDYLNPLGALRAATGIDRLRVVGADAATGRGTSLAAGKYVTNNVYVEVVTDTKGFTATQIEVALSRALSILSQTGGLNGTSISVKYSKDY